MIEETEYGFVLLRCQESWEQYLEGFPPTRLEPTHFPCFVLSIEEYVMIDYDRTWTWKHYFLHVSEVKSLLEDYEDYHCPVE